MKTLRLRHIHLKLVEVPIYETHERGKNWAALINIMPGTKGEIQREWLSRRAGKFGKYVLPDNLVAKQIIEFGADYITGVGKRRPKRVYAVVVELTETELVCTAYDTLKEAITGSR